MIPFSLESVTVRWESPKQPSLELKRDVKKADDAEKVLAIKFEPGEDANLFIHIADAGVVQRTQPKVTKIELIHIDAGGIKATPVVLEDKAPGQSSLAQRLNVNLEMGGLLKKMNTSLNLNLIEARVTVTGNGFQAVFLSGNLLHIALQQLIVFLPGVAGSKIATAGFPNEFSFPTWSASWVPGTDEFGRLPCDRFGSPEPGSQAVRTELFDTFPPFFELQTIARLPLPVTPEEAAKVGNLFLKQTIYNVREQDEILKPFNHPVLKKTDGKPFRHYELVPWPYDWRLRLEFAVSQLLDKEIPEAKLEPGEARNLGLVQPSLKKILDDNKPNFPLLADKVVLTGHSTGGVIMRRLLSDPKAKDLVRKAAFINTPFLGAPKAYFVYLTGDMLPIIANALLQKMSPHLPIVYYLAPSEQYPDPVAVFSEFPNPDTVVNRKPNQDIPKDFLNRLIANMGPNYPSPNVLDRWNLFLDRKAREFHGAMKVPVIGPENCRIFISRNTSSPTPGAVRPQGALSAGFLTLAGDGTVPDKSLKGISGGGSPVPELDNISVSVTPGGPAHDAAANAPEVWNRIIRDAIQVA